MAVKRYNGTAWITEAGAAAPLPSGMLAPFAGATAPTGWLLSDGSAISRTTYSALFAAIGTTYGTGDGTTTFNLPDLRGRTPFGKDNMGGTAASRVTSAVSGVTGTTLGAAGGDQRLHAHGHGITDPGHVHSSVGRTEASTVAAGFAGVTSALRAATNNYTLDTQLVTVNSNTTGITVNTNTEGGTAQNIPPAIILNYIIKV